ncbi:MAG: O-linked N-acetylglucosamine transferase family protein [Alphaproteobacteria bacterium]
MTDITAYTLSDLYKKNQAVIHTDTAKQKHVKILLAKQCLLSSKQEALTLLSNDVNFKFWRASRFLFSPKIHNEINANEKEIIDQCLAQIIAKNDPVKHILILGLFYFAADIEDLLPTDLPLHFENLSIAELALYNTFLQERPLIKFIRGGLKHYTDFYRKALMSIQENIEKTDNLQKKRILLYSFMRSDCCMDLLMGSENITDLIAIRGKLFEQYLEIHNLPLDHNFSPTLTRKKKRIGLLKRSLAPCTESFLIRPFFKDLDPDKFETFLYDIDMAKTPETAYAKDFRCLFDKTETFTFKTWGQATIEKEMLQKTVEKIRSDDLDFLLIGNLCSNEFIIPFPQIAAHRLARKQIITSAITPLSSGFRNIDFALTAPLTESDQAQDFYTEKTILEDGSFNCFDYTGRKMTPSKVIDKKTLDIPIDKTILTSGASLKKITPEQSWFWLEILKENPETVLLLYAYNPYWALRHPRTLFETRLQRQCEALNIDPARIYLLPPQNPADLPQVMDITDIYLDSSHFAGGASMMEPLQAHVPIVTRAGKSQRSLLGTAMLRVLGLDEWCTDSEENYKAAVKELVENPTLRTQRKTLLQEKMKTAPFLNTKSFAKRFESALEKIAKA